MSKEKMVSKREINPNIKEETSGFHNSPKDISVEQLKNIKAQLLCNGIAESRDLCSIELNDLAFHLKIEHTINNRKKKTIS